MSAIANSMGYAKPRVLPDGSYEPGLRLIHGDAGRNLVGKAKSGLSSVWAFITSNVIKAWGWVNKTLHLSQGWNWAQTNVIKPARFVIRMVADRVGYTGGVGTGLLLVSTGVGRKILHYTIEVPAAFAAKWLGKGYRKTMDFHTDHLGGYGDWVADRMASLEKYVWGIDSTSGVVGNVTGFYIKHIAPHLHLNSILMRSARVVGTALFGISMVGLLPMFITGTILSAGVYLIAGTTIVLVGAQGYYLGTAIGSALQSVPVIAKWLGNDDTESAATATVRGVNITTLADDVAATTDRKPKHDPHVRGHNPNVRSAK